jgi:hypothetical protein
MPYTQKDLEDVPFFFCKKGDVWVTVGPYSATYWRGNKIPLDGRQYQCGGTIIFKNGQSFRSSFNVDTTTFDFVSKKSIYLNIDTVWYNIDEPELLLKLNLTFSEIYPLTWITDRPLDYHLTGPYILNKRR